MKSLVAKFQIGKNGLTKDVIASLVLAFKNRKQVRVSVLQDRKNIKNIAEEISEGLPFGVNYRIIGFTIILLKQRKNPSLKKNLKLGKL